MESENGDKKITILRHLTMSKFGSPGVTMASHLQMLTLNILDTQVCCWCYFIHSHSLFLINNQLEKLEAAKAACSVLLSNLYCICLLGLT